uniref:HAD-IC family P-type ATPase n=1 Tax=Thiocapsa sp. TaxID=2024551 RepID=UPI003593190A
PAALEGLESVTGMGLVGKLDGQRVMVGSERTLAAPAGSDAETLAGTLAATMRSEGQTLIFLTVEGRLVGLIGVADAIKPSARQAIDALHRRGIQVIMMTGDNRTTAGAVADALGIDEIYAEVMPEQKADKVKALQDAGRRVAMAGDGVNDAPALAQADVGIAFATGTDVAIESADITLLQPDLMGLVKAHNLSRATMRNIRQNLAFAFGYNALGVPIAAGVLYPILGILLSPMIASAAMTLSSVSVIGNALRLRRVRL